jgi:hypothetical protein
MSISCQSHHIQLSKNLIDDFIRNYFSRPNRAIMVTDQFMRFRKYGTGLGCEGSLSDLEIRDLFNNGSSEFTCGNYSNAEGYGVSGRTDIRNNLCLLCSSEGGCNGFCPSCEWVSFGGPYGYTTIEKVTRSPSHGRLLLRNLILSIKPYDIIWLLELDRKRNNWSTIGKFPALATRQATIIGNWPNLTPYQYI